MAHPPLQPRRRLHEAGPRREAADPGGGEARLASDSDPAPAKRGHIELRLRQLAQLFHSLDPSPFRERELDATAEEFIAGWASDYPAHVELELSVHLEEARRESEAELDQMVRDAVRNHFDYRARSTRREYRALTTRGRRSILVGLVFYSLCFLTGQAVGRMVDSTLARLAAESLMVGGWVVLWRPLEIFLYDRGDVRRREREFLRLARMSVHVVCPRGT